MATDGGIPVAAERAATETPPARERAAERTSSRVPSPRAVRNRLARMGGGRNQNERPELEPLFRSIRNNHPKADLALIERAYRTAEHLHGTQMRKSGDPYITHPLAVTTILADIGMTEPTLVAALLHDTVEDTQTTAAELDAHFGRAVAATVMEVTDDKTLPKAARKQQQIDHAPHLSHGAKLVKLADKISNLRDVSDSPPAGWPVERKREYFDWARRVIDGVRGTNARLEALFDAEYARRP